MAVRKKKYFFEADTTNPIQFTVSNNTTEQILEATATNPNGAAVALTLFVNGTANVNKILDGSAISANGTLTPPIAGKVLEAGDQFYATVDVTTANIYISVLEIT